jgi:hypothetical protein
MIIFTHVIIALTTMLISGAAYVAPTNKKILASYMLIFSTLLSGTILVAVSNASILRTCVTGLVFVSITTALTLGARKKLATTNARDVE